MAVLGTTETSTKRTKTTAEPTPAVQPQAAQPQPAQSQYRQFQTGQPQPAQTEGTGENAAVPATGTAAPVQTTINSSKIISKLTEGVEPVTIDRVEKYDKQPMVDMATQQVEAARQQFNNRIDNATNQGIAEIRRAENDARAEFEAQQEQIAADELNALDNAALYAEARGDKGGIGQAQYGSIQNTAAQNRQAVRNAQTKLATDSARQIGDLRAKGEFDKADAMLELTQTFLSEMRNIEEFAANYNLNVDQINTAISQWEADYAKSVKEFMTGVEMSVANMTGAFADGTPTLDALKENNQNLADIAMSLLGAGMAPDKLTEEQKAALAGVYGMDDAQIEAYATMIKKSGSRATYVPSGDDGNDGNDYVDELLGGGNDGAPDLSYYLDYTTPQTDENGNTYYVPKEEVINAAVGAGATREEAEARYNWAANK